MYSNAVLVQQLIKDLPENGRFIIIVEPANQREATDAQLWHFRSKIVAELFYLLRQIGNEDTEMQIEQRMIAECGLAGVNAEVLTVAEMSQLIQYAQNYLNSIL